MELRVEPAKGTKNGFSYALQVATDYAAACGHPFDASELWKASGPAGLYFEDKGNRVAESPATERFGVFVCQLALDHLFNQRLIQRSINSKGDWVYRGSA